MHVTSKMCMLKDLGMNGNLFGGHMMAWTDEAAAIFAHKITHERNMVTKQFGEIIFKRPVKPGHIIDFHCFLTQFSTSSISFLIQVEKEKQLVFQTSCVFVAVNEIGVKKCIEDKKDLIITSPGG